MPSSYLSERTAGALVGYHLPGAYTDASRRPPPARPGYATVGLAHIADGRRVYESVRIMGTAGPLTVATGVRMATALAAARAVGMVPRCPPFVLVERGDGQPLNLFSAFERPVAGPGLMDASVSALTKQRAAFAASYGKWWDGDVHLRVGEDGAATLDALAEFAAAAVAHADDGARP